MTYENVKRLHEHFVKIGNKELAELYEVRMKSKAAKLGIKEEPKDDSKSKGKK